MTNDELFDGFAGGGEPPKSHVRRDVTEPEDLIVKSELDRRMARLLTLHPQLRIRFRTSDLSSFDDQTKEALLRDMYDILGIAPLRNA